MLKIPNLLSRLDRVGLPRVLAPLALGVGLVATSVAPVKALPLVQGGGYIRVGQPYPVYPNTVIYGGSPSTIIYTNPMDSPYIYNGPTTTTSIVGSPIPSPIPLNQGTGVYTYPSNGYYNVNPVLPGVATPYGYDSDRGRTVIINSPGYSNNLIYPGRVVNSYPGYGYPGQTRIFIRR